LVYLQATLLLPDYLFVYLLSSYRYSRQTTYMMLNNNKFIDIFYSIYRRQSGSTKWDEIFYERPG
jgi:hypothetical protein